MYLIAIDMSLSNQSQRGARQRGPKKAEWKKSAVLQGRNTTENLVVELTCGLCVISPLQVLMAPSY